MAIIEDSSSPSGYRNEVTGRFAKAAVSTKASGADDKSQPEEKKQTQNNLGATQIVSALRQEFSGLNKHLAFRFDSVIKAMSGTEAEKRDAAIISGNTDPKPAADPADPPESRNFLKNLKGLNPFSKDRNPFVRILAFGALALALGSEKLQPVLAKVLEWVKETFIPWVSSMWTAIKDYDWSAQFEVVKAFFTKIKDFFMQFDTNEDGKLQFDELKLGVEAAVKTLIESFGTMLKDGVTTLFEKYGTEIALVFGAYVVSKVAMTALIGGSAAAAGKIGLVGVLIAGVGLLIGKIKGAYNDAITDELGNEQQFDMSEWVAYMLAGPDNKEGKASWFDAFTSSWKDALAGAAVGAGIGALAGGGLFSIPGILIGAFTGALLGTMGQKVGSDKIDEEIDKAGVVFGQLQDDMITIAQRVASHGTALVDAMAAVFDSNVDVKDVVAVALEGDGQLNFDNADRQIRSKKKRIQQILIDVELNKTFAGDDIAYEKGLNAKNYADLNRLSDEIKALNIVKTNAFKTADETNLRAKANNLYALNDAIDAKNQSIADTLNAPGYTGGMDSEFMSGELADLKALEAKKNALLQSSPKLQGLTLRPLLDFKDLLIEKPNMFERNKKGFNFNFNQKHYDQIKLDNLNKNFQQPPSQIIDASNTNINQGDIVTSALTARLKSDTAAILSNQWPDLYRV